MLQMNILELSQEAVAAELAIVACEMVTMTHEKRSMSNWCIPYSALEEHLLRSVYLCECNVFIC